jgi:2-C-methyl-D-erythritol 4-phosphate cytidylyltransferase
VVNLTQALAQEWLSDGIRVNCINPERTRTEMRRRNFGHEDESSLLDPQAVGEIALKVLRGGGTGEICDIKVREEL